MKELMRAFAATGLLLAGCENLPEDSLLKQDLATAGVALDAAANEGLAAVKGALTAADQAITRAVTERSGTTRTSQTSSGTLTTTALPLSRRPVATNGQKSLVKDVQNDLSRLGYYSGPIDGFAGPHTLSAVQRYQVDHGLDADGWVTRDLAAHISGSLMVAER
jgi:peptidoglycan hydrolase-like protein with peptidoglycan-binding domain